MQQKSLEARISILKDKLIEQSNSYDRMQNKMFAIVGLLLTIAGLITYEIFKIPVPNSFIEFIISTGALLSFCIALGVIGYDYRATKTWSVPIGALEEEKLNNAPSYLAALKIIHEDYRLANQEREVKLDSKAKYLNSSFFLFVLGVILVIVLKIGGQP